MECLVVTQQCFVPVAARRYNFNTFVKWWQIRSADCEKSLFKAEIASFTWAIVGWAWWNDMPWNEVVNVLVFKSPDMFAALARVSVFFVTKWCSVVSVFVLKSFSDVRFRSVIVLVFDDRLVDNWWLAKETTEAHWERIVLQCIVWTCNGE